jgi:phage gpG-like protein
MPQDFDVNVDGLKQLRKDLRGVDRDALKEVQKVLKDAAGLAAITASELAPRRTGELARSYRAFTRGNVAGVRSPLPYAGVVEYGGTIRPKGVPIKFRKYEPVTRAVERQREAIVEHIGDGLDAAALHNGWH